jgi:ubiquinone/menaquinone biosynthesis C-methylase UbiE
MTKPEPRPNICDYEGSDYRTAFWEGRGRDYEDKVERIALRRLLPINGRRLLEVGAGFGRLTGEYDMFAQVVLLDYSLSQLQYAQEQLGHSSRFVYVAADAYRLPFQAGVFDAATMIRVIHHMAKVGEVLTQLRRVLVPQGQFVLEHANKRNLKAILRYALQKQEWSPYDLTPIEFVELNFDFHPEYIKRELEKAGFKIERRLPVSFFRLQTLKERVSTELLVSIDSLMQPTGLLISPSVFVKSIAVGSTPNNLDANLLFACPDCGGDLVHRGDVMICEREGRRWAVRDGIYDFKAPIEDA